LGFEVIDFARDVLEIELLPWQQWLFIHGLELKPDDSFRFRTVLVLVPRQCGKTTALMVLALWRLVMDGAQMVLGTSTNLDYAKEAWQKAVQLAWGPEGAKYFKGVHQLEGVFTKPRYANGEQTLSTVDGARYKIGTASETGGRSLSIDLAILDELRTHKNFAAWAAASKTTNARPRGQRWALSNMGDDTSVVLNHFQEQARLAIKNGGGDPSLALYEWSAPEGCATDDREAWRVAIPALGHTISEETIASDELSDPEAVFRTEVLCQRVPNLQPQPIDPMAWALCELRLDESPERPVFFLDSWDTVDDRITSIGVAGMWNGKPHLELAHYASGVDWLPGRVAELKKRYPGAKFAVSNTGAVTDMLPALKPVEPIRFSVSDMGRACVHLKKLVDTQGVTHSGAAGLTQALNVAVKRDIGDELWTWSRRKSGDISPLVAVTGAAWLLETRPRYDLLDSVL
jgi:hypothetical protein